MNLLLLLSALLSALTGVAGGVRAPQVAQAVAGAQRAGEAKQVSVRTAAARPANDLPTLVASAATAFRATVALRAVEPLWASRRRE